MLKNFSCLNKLFQYYFSVFQSLPQTPAGGVGGKGSGSAGAGSGMVNGSGADHQDIRDGAAINTEHVSNSILRVFCQLKIIQVARSNSLFYHLLFILNEI